MSEERIKSEEDLDATQELTAEQLEHVAGGARELQSKKNEEQEDK
jgi:hypothetical protein